MPFVLVSGKQLDERTAHVQVVFESNIHKVHSALSETEKCDVREIVFHIQGEHAHPKTSNSYFRNSSQTCIFSAIESS